MGSATILHALSTEYFKTNRTPQEFWVITLPTCLWETEEKVIWELPILLGLLWELNGDVTSYAIDSAPILHVLSTKWLGTNRPLQNFWGWENWQSSYYSRFTNHSYTFVEACPHLMQQYSAIIPHVLSTKWHKTHKTLQEFWVTTLPTCHWKTEKDSYSRITNPPCTCVERWFTFYAENSAPISHALPTKWLRPNRTLQHFWADKIDYVRSTSWRNSYVRITNPFSHLCTSMFTCYAVDSAPISHTLPTKWLRTNRNTPGFSSCETWQCLPYSLKKQLREKIYQSFSHLCGRGSWSWRWQIDSPANSSGDTFPPARNKSSSRPMLLALPELHIPWPSEIRIQWGARSTTTTTTTTPLNLRFGEPSARRRNERSSHVLPSASASASNAKANRIQCNRNPQLQNRVQRQNQMGNKDCQASKEGKENAWRERERERGALGSGPWIRANFHAGKGQAS